MYRSLWFLVERISSVFTDGSVLNPSIDRTTRRTGEWSALEDIDLNDAVQTHGGKDWFAVAALVPS
jgi:hypothetical protein